MFDSYGAFLSLEYFNNIFGLNANFLIFHGIKKMINEMMTKFNFSMNDVKNTCGPKLPPYLKNIIINNEGSKQTYNLLNTNNTQPTGCKSLIYILKKQMERNIRNAI
jgi:hypothetical protein